MAQTVRLGEKNLGEIVLLFTRVRCGLDTGHAANYLVWRRQIQPLESAVDVGKGKDAVAGPIRHSS